MIAGAVLLQHAPLVRAVNFHNTPRHRAGIYAAQLQALARAGLGAADEDTIEAMLDGRRPCRPVVLPVLYEGYRNNYEVALPLVEAAGLTAWFFVPTAFLDVPEREQHDWLDPHHLELAGPGDPERVAMTWEELRDVAARGHVVCCHTASHVGQAELSTDADVERELREPKRRLEAELGQPVRSVAFLWGTPYGTDARIDAVLREEGFRLVVSNTRIQRIAR